MKKRNPRYGCPRIVQQINLAFGLDLDKDTVRRILAVPDESYFKQGSVAETIHGNVASIDIR